ncbi:hypothetical protein [Bacillus cereus group sp. N11]|nr:hypothetical protein [Bacillus cereus group sp. N11]
MVEILANKNEEFTKALHCYVESGESFRNNKDILNSIIILEITIVK